MRPNDPLTGQSFEHRRRGFETGPGISWLATLGSDCLPTYSCAFESLARGVLRSRPDVRGGLVGLRRSPKRGLRLFPQSAETRRVRVDLNPNSVRRSPKTRKE